MTEKMIRIRVTGEPAISRPTTEIVELPASQFAGLTPEDRERAIERAAEDATLSMFTWGYEELADGES
jgi:hypothetical protein